MVLSISFVLLHCRVWFDMKQQLDLENFDLSYSEMTDFNRASKEGTRLWSVCFQFFYPCCCSFRTRRQTYCLRVTQRFFLAINRSATSSRALNLMPKRNNSLQLTSQRPSAAVLISPKASKLMLTLNSRRFLTSTLVLRAKKQKPLMLNSKKIP
ncbi:hypothetical protein D3C87_1362460 [compost metagenome]